jgi:very-short-patch-repair endonuclease
VDLGDMLAEWGGVATRASLIAATSRARVDRAVRSGEVVVLAPGRYAVPGLDDAVRAAHRLCGVLSRESAALRHGWAVKAVPDAPHISVPRNRKVPASRRGWVKLHRDDLRHEDVEGIATSKEYTLRQCMRLLSFDAGLAVADSALRSGESPALLHEIAASTRGPGSPQVRRIASEATAEAANPFESVLRAIALDVVGLRVVPQRVIDGSRATARPDLVDEELRIVLEADSFSWHGDRAALRRDARRYNLLVADGWTVLRFAWEEVMSAQDHVRDVLTRTVNLVARRTEPVAGPRRLA